MQFGIIMNSNRYSRNGKTAVVIASHRDGLWGLGNPKHMPECIFDPTLVELVLHMNYLIDDDASNEEIGESIRNIENYAKNKWGSTFDASAAELLVVKWIPTGEQFWIQESQTEREHEELCLISDLDLITA